MNLHNSLGMVAGELWDESSGLIVDEECNDYDAPRFETVRAQSFLFRLDWFQSLNVVMVTDGSKSAAGTRRYSRKK